jgi:hypothetical protein
MARRNPIPLAATPFRDGEVRVDVETREPKGTNPGLWSFLLWVTTDALRRLKLTRKLAGDRRGFHVEPVAGWQHVGSLWLRTWPDTPEVYVETSHVHDALHGKRMGVYLYSFAADIAGAMGRPIVSSMHDRSKAADRVWKSQTLRQFYDVRQEGGFDVLALKHAVARPKRRIRSMGELSVGR